MGIFCPVHHQLRRIIAGIDGDRLGHSSGILWRSRLPEPHRPWLGRRRHHLRRSKRHRHLDSQLRHAAGSAGSVYTASDTQPGVLAEMNFRDR